MWDYAWLSKLAKKVGGPKNLIILFVSIGWTLKFAFDKIASKFKLKEKTKEMFFNLKEKSKNIILNLKCKLYNLF